MKKTVINHLRENSSLHIFAKRYRRLIKVLSEDAWNLEFDYVANVLSTDNQMSNLLIQSARRYSGRNEINKVKSALLIIGISSAQNLLIYFLAKNLYARGTKETGSARKFDIGKYWKHCLGTSVAVEFLAERYNFKDKYKLFTVGLIHDIGVLILDNFMPEKIDEVYLQLRSGVDFLNAEKMVLDGLTHADVGALFCELLEINQEITNFIKYHESPMDVKTNTKEVKLLHIADKASSQYYCKLIGGRLNDQFYKYLESLELVGKKDILDVSLKLPDLVEKTRVFYKL